jgi:hypothetical protein
LATADFAKFFGVGEDEVHVFVKGEHLACHLSAVVEGHAHTVVDQIGLDEVSGSAKQTDKGRLTILPCLFAMLG